MLRSVFCFVSQKHLYMQWCRKKPKSGSHNFLKKMKKSLVQPSARVKNNSHFFKATFAFIISQTCRWILFKGHHPFFVFLKKVFLPTKEIQIFNLRIIKHFHNLFNEIYKLKEKKNKTKKKKNSNARGYFTVEILFFGLLTLCFQSKWQQQ